MSAANTEVTLDLDGREASVLERRRDAHAAAVKELSRWRGRAECDATKACCLHTDLRATPDMDTVKSRA